MDETRGLNLGAVDFITKPFSTPVAKARIEAHLRLKAEMDHRISLARKLEDLNENLETRIQIKTSALEQAHEDLKTSESKYRGIYENAIEGIFQTTPEGRFLDASPSLARHLGYDSPQELVATITDAAHQLYFRPQDRKIVLQALAQKGEISGFETQFKKKNGEVIWGMASVKAVRDENSGESYFQGFVVDVTERKRAEADIRRLNQELEQRVVDRTVQLEAANKELEAFAYSVSHDLRAPLRHIDGYMELLQKKVESVLDEQGRHYMDTISGAATKMGRLIDDLLAFSRMGRHALAVRPVALKKLVDEIIQELMPDIAGRRIDWRIGDLPSVSGDEAMLRMALDNLIANAVKFTRTRKQARIEIGAQPIQGTEVVIFVRDNGVGFDMTYVDKLFGVFQRLHLRRGVRGHRHRVGQCAPYRRPARRSHLGGRRTGPRCDIFLFTAETYFRQLSTGRLKCILTAKDDPTRHAIQMRTIKTAFGVTMMSLVIVGLVSAGYVQTASASPKAQAADTLVSTSDKTSIRIGVLAKRGRQHCLDQWGPTAAYLSQQIPECSFSILPLDFDHIFEAVANQKVDFIFANSSFYVELEVRFGVTRIATLNNLHSDGTAHAVFFRCRFYFGGSHRHQWLEGYERQKGHGRG